MKWLSDMNKRKFNSWSFGNPMSIRFFEGDEDDATTLAIKEAEEAERKKQEDFDKARQRADQEAANAQKARQQAAQASQQLAEMQTKGEAMQAEIDALKAKAVDQGIDLKEEDFEDSDKTLVKAIKALEVKFEASKSEIADLKKTKNDLLAERQAEQTKRQRNKVYDDLLSDLDTEYGQQFRNAAVKQFDKIVAEGKVPNNAAMSTRALEKCYKDAKKAAEKDLKENPQRGLSLDPGAGGGSPNLNRAKLKPGSLADVSAQLRSASKE